MTLKYGFLSKDVYFLGEAEIIKYRSGSPCLLNVLTSKQTSLHGMILHKGKYVGCIVPKDAVNFVSESDLDRAVLRHFKSLSRGLPTQDFVSQSL